MKSAAEVFQEYLRTKTLRQSEQRDKILDIFLATEKHLTIAAIYKLARKKYPNIGYATVYRSMKIICESGLAEEIDVGDGSKRYEHKYGHEHHDHLICTRCGRFTEVVKPQIEKLQKAMAKEHGFAISWHKMQIFGICKECGEKRK